MSTIPNISIIIPVYNVELYIKECIESVLNQTLRNIEIIIINDGSTDRSLEKIKEFDDDRIRIINKENGGLSSARNRGIKEAIGKYIFFLDSDDFLVNNICLEEIYKLAEYEDVDMMECKYDLYNYKGVLKSKTKYLNKFKKRYVLIDEYIENLIGTNFVPVCFKIFKREIIIKKNILFREGFLHEDEDFTPRILLCIKKIGIYNREFYGYRIREGSITDIKNEKRTKDIIEISYDLIKFLNKIPNSKNINMLKNRSIKIIFEKIYLERVYVDNEIIELLYKTSDDIITKLYCQILKKNRNLFFFIYKSMLRINSAKDRVGAFLCLENN